PGDQGLREPVDPVSAVGGVGAEVAEGRTGYVLFTVPLLAALAQLTWVPRLPGGGPLNVAVVALAGWTWARGTRAGLWWALPAGRRRPSVLDRARALGRPGWPRAPRALVGATSRLRGARRGGGGRAGGPALPAAGRRRTPPGGAGAAEPRAQGGAARAARDHL